MKYIFIFFPIMFYFTRSIRKLINSKCINSSLFVSWNKNSLITLKEFEQLTKTSTLRKSCLVISSFNFQKVNVDSYLENKRFYSKRKGPPKRTVEVEDESDSEEEENEESTADDEVLGDTLVKKNVASLRLDSIIKAGLGLTKKKIEQEFYAFKLRVNGKPVVKKALNIYVGDEVDVIKGFSPDTSKYLIVNWIVIKGIDKVTGTGQFPVKMEVLKELIVENYEDPWNPSSVGQLDK